MPTEEHSKACGPIIRERAKVCFSTQTGINMTAIGKIIKKRDKEPCTTQTEKSMKVSGRKTNSTGRGS